jgi:hypothetical protein
MEIGNINYDKLDPDWRVAYLHAQSKRPGMYTD